MDTPSEDAVRRRRTRVVDGQIQVRVEAGWVTLPVSGDLDRAIELLDESHRLAVADGINLALDQ
jgi:hypothetical protein